MVYDHTRINRLMQIFKREESIASLIRNGKQNIIEGTYEELVLDEYIKMTIGMPGLSEEEDVIEVEFFERENGGTQMFFYYRSFIEKERRLTTLEYKQKKKNIMIQQHMDLN